MADTRTRVAVKTEQGNRITAQEQTPESCPQGKHQQVPASVLSAFKYISCNIFLPIPYTKTTVLLRTLSCDTWREVNIRKLSSVSCYLINFFHPEDGCNNFLRNICKILPCYTSYSWQLQLWEPQIQHLHSNLKYIYCLRCDNLFLRNNLKLIRCLRFWRTKIVKNTAFR